MTKQSLIALVLLAALGSVPAFAAPVACTGTPNDTGTQPWGYFAGLSADGCFQQDKLYKNFQISLGSLPSNLQGKISFVNIGLIDTHLINWSVSTGVFNTDFTIKYDVSVYQPVNPSTYISQVGVSIEPSGAPGALATMTATGLGGPYVLTAPTGGNPAVTNTSSLPSTLSIGHRIIASSLAPAQSSTVQVVENLPEPGSVALFGLGLAGLGFFRRARKAK
jgi:hypothetical protein